MKRIALLALFSMLPFGASAARLTLRDGSVVYGTFVSGSDRNIVFQDENGVRRRFDTSQVRSVDFDAMSTSAGSPGSSGSVFGNDRVGSRDRVDDRYSSRVVPAGASIQVRTNENIEADTAISGRTYNATIEKDVVDSSGMVVIPRGSDARMVVRNVEEGGRVTSGNLVLDLESVTANGQYYRVSTAEVERGNERGLGANRRTAEMVGGGAALGTVIGAIAGGGKGAAIGAAIGAAAGAGAQVLTKGDRIRVPAETVLEFRLDQPIRLEPMR